MRKLTPLFFALIPSGLLAAEGPPPPPSSDFTQTLVMVGIALLFCYLILWRPEQKRRSELEQQRAGLKKGDRVTAMGIIGTVEKINETTVILKMHDGSLLEFVKAAIAEIHEA